MIVQVTSSSLYLPSNTYVLMLNSSVGHFIKAFKGCAVFT